MDRFNSNQSRKLSSNLSDPHRDYEPPPPPDESYWSALLREGEVAASGPQRQNSTSWDGFEPAASSSAEPRSKHESEDWDAVQKTFDQDLAVELGVVGYNRGGLLVEWNSLRGFVPASQLVSFPVVNDVQARRNELAARIGQKLSLRVIELDRVQNR